jgi:hypothetical protein
LRSFSSSLVSDDESSSSEVLDGLVVDRRSSVIFVTRYDWNLNNTNEDILSIELNIQI